MWFHSIVWVQYLPLSCIFTQLGGFSIFSSFRYNLCKESLSVSVQPPATIVFMIARLGGMQVLDVQDPICLPTSYTPSYSLLIPIIISPSWYMWFNAWIWHSYISGLLLPPPWYPDISLIYIVQYQTYGVWIHLVCLCWEYSTWVDQHQSSPQALHQLVHLVNKSPAFGHFGSHSRGAIPWLSYWYSLVEISSSPIKSGIWCTSFRHWKRFSSLGTTIVAHTQWGCSGAFIQVTLRQVKVYEQVLYFTQLQSNASSWNTHKSQGLSSGYPLFLHWTCLSHQLLLCCHPLMPLSDY